MRAKKQGSGRWTGIPLITKYRQEKDKAYHIDDIAFWGFFRYNNFVSLSARLGPAFKGYHTR